MNVVAPAAAIEPQHEHDRPLQDRGQAERTNREARRFAEEWETQAPFAVQAAIRQDPNEMSFIQPPRDREHRTGASQTDDIHRERGIDRVQHLIRFAGIVFIHHQADAGVAKRAAGGAHDLETAEMGAEQEPSAVPRAHAGQHVFAMQSDVEQVHPVVEQQHAIEHAGGEAPDMAPPVGRGRPTPECLGEPGLGRRACLWRAQEKIGANRTEEEARRGTPKAQRDPDHEPDQCQLAAFPARRPFLPPRDGGAAAHGDGRRNAPLRAGRSEPSIAHENLISPPVSPVHAMTSVSPGRTG